jgi:hypothetical protein
MSTPSQAIMPTILYYKFIVASQRFIAVIQKLANIITFIGHLENSTDTKAITHTYAQVIVALATLQSSVQDLSRAYINHANTVLNPGRGGALDANLTNILTESGLIGAGRMQPQDLQINPEEPASGEKKKRKRAKHDPNAPKRALTPYFLYMQSARSLIATELGEHAKPKEVADEGTRRWGEMKAEDKQVSYFHCTSLIHSYLTSPIILALVYSLSPTFPYLLIRLYSLIHQCTPY